MKWQSMWESNPEQASMLLNPEDGYKYSQCSAQKVEWKCPSCGHIQKAMISNVYKRGLSCLICNDGISIPNKFMASLLEELKEDYTPEYIITGANYRYDFYFYFAYLILQKTASFVFSSILNSKPLSIAS